MKFGKEFSTHLGETLPEWRDKFLCYKPLKQFLKNLPSTNRDVSVVDEGRHPREDERSVTDLQQWFIRILNEELEKFNDFFVNKEEDFVIRLQELKDRAENLTEKDIIDGRLRQDSKFSDEIMKIRRDFVAIHGEMVLLKSYSSLNFAGLIKILKKYDKRTGRLLCLPFSQLALHQPFSTMEPLTRLVHECEQRLEMLFPSEAEVVQQSISCPSDGTAFSTNENVDESRGVDDIYRSTLAAMKAIRGLQKASSTYNPFSFGPLFRRRDGDSPGSVTGESSPPPCHEGSNPK